VLLREKALDLLDDNHPLRLLRFIHDDILVLLEEKPSLVRIHP